MDLPFISVIVPVFNHEKFVGQALNSIWQQTYPFLEIIIIDDGSTDRSCEKIEEVIDQWSISTKRKVTFIRQTNQGAHLTINKGLELATGDYLTILNSDDYYHIARLEKLVDQLTLHSSELIFSKVSAVDENDHPFDDNDPWHRWYEKALFGISDYPGIGFTLLQANIAVSSGNLFFSKKLYQKVGPFGDLKLAHDLDFLVRCLPWTEPIFFDDELYFYRFHGSNTTYQVKHLLHQEMQAIYFKYLSLVTWEAPLNPLAPCKWYWPYEFTFLRQKLNMDQMLIKTILKGKQNAPTSFTTWDKQATTFRKTLAFAADLTKFYFCTPQTIQLEGVKQWPIWLILACLPFKKVHWHIPEECHPNAIIPGGFARKLFQKFCHNNALTFSFNSERTFQQWQRQGIKGYVLEKPPLSSPQEIQIEFKKNQWNKIHAELNKFISAKNQNQLPLETRLKIKNFPYQDCEASVGDFILKVMNSGYKDQIDL